MKLLKNSLIIMLFLNTTLFTSNIFAADETDNFKCKIVADCPKGLDCHNGYCTGR